MSRRMSRRLAPLLLALAAASTMFTPAAEAALRQIAVGNFYFEDETVGDGKVTARVGDQLRFSVLDGGPGTPHTVDVDELDIHSGSLGSGETFTTPPLTLAGTFVLYCRPHDKRGHKTTLVVSDAPVTPPPTAPSTTTTTAATTTSTVAATTTTKAPAKTTTTTGGGSAGTPTPPTTTETPATGTTAAPGTATTAPATTSSSAGSAGPGSAATSDGVDSTPAGAAPPGPGDGDRMVADPGETALAPVGRGTVGDGSADEFFDRLPVGKSGPWTRSIHLSLAALPPMAFAAAIALWRWSPPSDPDRP